jgi:ectoine hydroxylase-related dioxygenase (phytanoyl-CoA dioxygenase family)
MAEAVSAKTDDRAIDGHGSHPGARSTTTPLTDIRKTRPLRVLTEDDWQHWVSKGFVVVRNAVPRDKVDAVADMLWQFQEMDRDDSSTWYRPQFREHKMKELNNTGMVEVYNHQSLWDTRQYPKIYDAFVDIWDREDLWVAIDRANLNPPNKASRAAGQVNGFIHFDVDVSQRPLPIAVQGVLSLAKQDSDVGGFQCVPGIFSQIEDWWGRQPAGSNPFKPDTGALEIVNIEMDAGDFLIFNSLLAHGVRPNRSDDRVRMAQYISMFPADFANEPLRRARIRTWAERTHPIGDAFPGDPREFERKLYPVATLNDLGRKLLGLDPWA